MSPDILIVPECVIHTLGVEVRLVVLPGVPGMPLVVGAGFCFAKSHEKLFCEIVEDPWWFLDEFWWALMGFPLFFEGFKDFAGFLGAAGPPVAVRPAAPPQTSLSAFRLVLWI